METLDVRGTPLDLHIWGSGAPLLYLHAEQFFERTMPHLEALAAAGNKVIVPRHPGFTARAMPADFRSAEDLAYLYLDLLDQLALKEVTLAGASFGGWIALEMAVRNCSRIARLALVSSVGVKLGKREDRDFADIFYLNDKDAQTALFADPKRWAPDYAAVSDDELASIVRERQATAYYGWKPYLHNPLLGKWLHRVDVPALVLWGDRDRFATPEYGRKLAERLPKGELKLIEGASHYPQIEQAKATADAISSFAQR